MDKRKIILDYDPGHDDTAATVLTTRSPQIDLLGITVAAGNQMLEKTTANVLNVCQYLGLDIPVHAGYGQLVIWGKQVTADDIHGETGLDGPVFVPLQKKAEDKHAMLCIIDTLMASDGDVTLMPTDSLTDVTMAICLEPRILPKIRETVPMEGCHQLGNVTPATEFNTLADADAAHAVLTYNRPITMVGLGATRKVLCYSSVIERVEKIGTPPAILFVDLMRFLSKSRRVIFGWEGGSLHDPLIVAYLIDPAVLTTKAMFTEIDTRSIRSYSRMNCDSFGYFKRESNSNMAVEVDVEKFWDAIEQGIRNYG